MIDKKKGKRLGEKKWEEIKLLFFKPDRNISKIAKQYGLSRHSVYEHSWRHGWLKRKPIKSKIKSNKGFWSVLLDSLMGKPHISHANARKQGK